MSKRDINMARRIVFGVADLPLRTHEVVWDGRNATGRAMASGSCLARLEAGRKVEAARLSLVR
jgi:hypothetical protein